MISILLPTRNRPDNVRRLYQSLIDTSDNMNDLEICFFIDDDDEISLNLVTELASKINVQAVQYTQAETGRTPQPLMYNELYKIGTGPIYMFCADDVVFRTRGWDSKVKAEFNKYEDRIVLVYGPDGFQFGKVPVCTHGFLHNNWIKTIGYFFPPYFNIAYNDTWLTEIAETIGRRIYLNDLYFEHIHPAAGKAAWDDVYTGKQEVVGGETNLYRQLAPQRQEDIDKLKKYIESFK